jgi:hypothetical protein
MRRTMVGKIANQASDIGANLITEPQNLRVTHISRS